MKYKRLVIEASERTGQNVVEDISNVTNGSGDGGSAKTTQSAIDGPGKSENSNKNVEGLSDDVIPVQYKCVYEA